MIHVKRKVGVNRVFMLTVGWEDLPKSWSVHGVDPEIRLVEPVPVVLIESIDGWVMLDTGFNKALIEDPALYRRFHSKFNLIKPILPSYEVDPLLDALDRLDIAIDDISVVALSHLHNDHAGGIRHFSGGTTIVIQEDELAFGLGDQARSQAHGLARVDYDDPLINWHQISGDAEIAAGVDAIFTPGHTPGHMSFVVHLDGDESKGLVFAFDAGDLMENFDDEKPIGGFLDVTPEKTVEQIQRLKRIASEFHYQLIPGHDPDVWPTMAEGLTRQVHL